MLDTLDLNKYDEALSRGLCEGKGDQSGQMCIEAAICYALGLPHGDDPQCVSATIRSFKITLNDSNWSSPESRAEGLRDLGLAQLGSLGVVDDVIFAEKLALATINKLIPTLFRELFPDNEKLLELALQCELAVDLETANAASASAARNAASVAARYAAASAASAALAAANSAAASAANVANVANVAARYAAASARSVTDAARNAANAARNAARNANDPDKYLKSAANLALDILKEMDSPGCKFLTR